MAAVMIGVDPHKGSHTAVAIDAAEEPLGQRRVRATDLPGLAGCWQVTGGLAGVAVSGQQPDSAMAASVRFPWSSASMAGEWWGSE